MPQYRAKENGFWNGALYGPNHKRRRIVHSDKKLDPVPKWLEPMEDEKPDEAKQRQRRTAAQKRADDAAQKEHDKAIKDADFMGGPGRSQPGVETL